MLDRDSVTVPVAREVTANVCMPRVIAFFVVNSFVGLGGIAIYQMLSISILRSRRGMRESTVLRLGESTCCLLADMAGPVGRPEDEE